MALSPEPMPENPIDFRAPPPSPIAAGRRSSVANDDVLTEFLEHSLRVPDLVLPDKIFPRQKTAETPPVIDFRSLDDKDSVDRILDSVARIGCFQLVNYGISSDWIELVMDLAAGIFSTPPEKRAAVMRSPERLFGFEENHGEEESEEFVWCKDENLKLDMESLWPKFSNFSEKMEKLISKMENIAEKIQEIADKNLKEKAALMKASNDSEEILINGKEMVGSMCYLQKHGRRRRVSDSLGYDVIRMLIRGCDYHSHSFCFHLLSHSSTAYQFHLYSKKGWLSFSPDKGAIVVTVGDQIQIRSGGEYKQVIGRPIVENEKQDSISLAFFYSPNSTSITLPPEGNTISLAQQLVFALILTLLYQIFCSFFSKN